MSEYDVNPTGPTVFSPLPSGIGRRDFIRKTAAGTSALFLTCSLTRRLLASDGCVQLAPDHFIPVEKNLKPEWLASLFTKGKPEWYSGDALDCIGMPVGGICAGQVYLSGEGRLVYWDVFNKNHNTGFGTVNWRKGRGPELKSRNGKLICESLVDQGFRIEVRQSDRTQTRQLARRDFPALRFLGQYPIAQVDYRDPEFPVEVSLEAFSPFIPLAAADSALPATLLNYTVRNGTDAPLKFTLTGWLSNAVCLHSETEFAGRFRRRSKVVRETGLSGFSLGAEVREREPIVFADFENGDYGAWQVTGNAFGTQPAGGTLPNQQAVSGFQGKGLVNTYLGGDQPQGRLISPEFTIERPFLSFLIGGGSQESRTCMNLLVAGRVVRSATGRDYERLLPCNWCVKEFIGQTARVEIVDEASGGWGHVNIDQIEFRDEPMTGLGGDLRRQPDFGTMGLFHLGEDALPQPGMRDLNPSGKQNSDGTEGTGGRLSVTRALEPGESVRLAFAVTWHMPNLYRGNQRVGNHYAKRCCNATEVARYIRQHLDRLAGDTRLWRDTYYDASFPSWLLDRLHSTTANLATTTCQWWNNGRFWAWEGGGCCGSTCGHVWNYEHAMARLFPELERSVREFQDFAEGVGLQADGSIGFRGEEHNVWAADSQSGYILKAYREHQCSTDGAFLKRNWPAIRRAIGFLLKEDANDDGLIEGLQHQTYDKEYFGANTFVGSLYLGALRAAEEMAIEVNDRKFAARCRRVFEAGRAHSVRRLFNGEYYIQDVDLKQHPHWQYGDGCLADQMFGQGWAHQVGLGYLYPSETVSRTLESIWKYCWAPDIAPQNDAHPPERWFASKDDAGLFTCTWPHSKHLGPQSTRYRNEIWTGIEYQVAGHMAWEGLLTQALAICRGIHDRYHPARFNPWNEIECGDHYARSMASWGVYLGLTGFSYHGPKAHLGFAPRLNPEDFKAAFTGAAGWGSIRQRRRGRTQLNEVTLRWGTLRLETIAVELPEGQSTNGKTSVTLDSRSLPHRAQWDSHRSLIQLEAPVELKPGETLRVMLATA